MPGRIFKCVLGLALLGRVLLFTAQPTAAATPFCLQYASADGGDFIANPATGQIDPLPPDQPRHAYADHRSRSVDFLPGLHTDLRYYFEIVPQGQNTVGLLLENTQAGSVSVLQTATAIAAQWSPQRDHLAWVWHDEQGDHLAISTGNGAGGRSGEIEHIDGWQNLTDVLVWSADAQYIAIQMIDHVVVVSTTDFKPISEASFQGLWKGWAPKGHRFVIGTRTGYALISPDAIFQLTFSAELSSDRSRLFWSPDARYLIVPVGADLNIFDTATGTLLPRLHPADPIDIYGELEHSDEIWGWSADSRYLIYPTKSPANSFDLVSFDTRTGQTIPLRTKINRSPVDPGLSIVFLGDQVLTTTQTRSGMKVGTIGVDGTNPRYFVDNADHIDRLTVSPEGQYIAFVASGAPPPNSIMNDSDQTPPPKNQPPDRLFWFSTSDNRSHILNYPNARILTWYGDQLLFLAGSPSKIQVMSLDPATGRTTVLVENVPYRRYINTYIWNWGHWEIAPSPDGQAILLQATVDFAGVEGAFNSESHTVGLRQNQTFGSAVYFAHLNGTGLRVLEDEYERPFAGLIRWSPDGTLFMWNDTTRFPAQIKIADANGHEVFHTDGEADAAVWIACPSHQ
jgi:hypothetical protein